jgi:dTDP-4-dehydrorhamnose 3,5-epimerase-like enzyme
LYRIINLDIHEDERGQLIAIENSRDIPFDIKRVFYIFNVSENAKRSLHANMMAQEIVLCLNGHCEVLLDNGKGQKVNIKLCRKNEAVYIAPKIWLEISRFSKNCLLLAMSDFYYNRKHQIHDYQEFLNAVR